MAQAAVDGKTVQAMADADQALTSADVAVTIIGATGALTARRTLTFPAPSGASASYHRVVHNACTGAPIVVGTSGARTIAIPPGCSSIVEFDENGAREIVGKAYDPRDFGCPWDGVHDDLPGLDAMMAVINAVVDENGLKDHSPAHIQLPRGKGYCSDNWHIAHPVHVVGHGWGIDDALSELENGIRFAPLRGIIVDSYFTQADYPLGMAGQGSDFRDVSIVSTQAIVAKPHTGNARSLRMLDTDLDVRRAGMYYPLGVCVLADGQDTTHGLAYLCEGATRSGPVVMFRVTTAGRTSSGAAPGAFATAGLDHLGDTITDEEPGVGGGVTWTVESIPKDYKNREPYVVGQRVFLPGDPACMFECVEEGTSIEFSSFGIGLGVTCPADMINPSYGGLFYDAGGAGPGLRWKTHMPMGFLFLAGACTAQHCSAAGFTGHGFYATDQTDPSIYGTAEGAEAEGNFTSIQNCYVTHCGSGGKWCGGNSNGCHVDWLNVNYVGLGRTNVDGPGYLKLADPTWGTGASCWWDAGLGGSSFRHIYGQGFAGAPFRNDRPDQAGSASVWLQCLAEVYEKSHFVEWPAVIQCHPLPETGQGIIIGAECRGLNFVDRVGADPLTAIICNGGVGLYQFQQTEDDGPYSWGWNYNGTYWGLKYGAAQPNAFTLIGMQTGTSPGLGWLAFNRGHLIGDPDGLMYRGPLASTGRPTGRLIDTNLRAGERKVGDRFEDPLRTVTIIRDGYRGYPWTPNTPVFAEYEPHSNPPSVIEPRANGDDPAAGLKVFKCTTPGRTGRSEPDWSPATVPGVDTIDDNDAVWTLVGITPAAIVTRGPGDGQATVDMADGEYTLSDAQVACATIKATGANMADRSLFFPAPADDADSYQRTIRAATDAHDVLVDVVGGAAPVTVANGKTAIVGFDSDGAYRVTADI